jgi:hypothetical protein
MVEAQSPFVTSPQPVPEPPARSNISIRGGFRSKVDIPGQNGPPIPGESEPVIPGESGPLKRCF